MSRYGNISIDGVDGWSEYGFFILRTGLNDWLAFPDMKEPFSHNWKDEHGIEVDLDNVFVKEKNVSLKILFVSDSQLGFWNNYKKLQEVLTSPGIRKIQIRELEKEFEVYYTKCSNVSPATRLRDIDKIVVEMTLHFVMPDPTKVDEKLIPPTSIIINVANDIIGYGSFSVAIEPTEASPGYRATILPGTGDAYISGNLIYAKKLGTVTLHVESTVDKSVYAEKTISVYPDNIIEFADGVMLEAETGEYITID